MLILSVGMPRAGSGWHYNLIHDLTLAAGGQDARQIRGRYRLTRLLTEVNCNLGTLGPHRLIPVLIPAVLGNTFAVKLHAGPRPLARLFIRLGLIRPTYIYRDPRAALLSAYESGQRGGSAFRHLDTIEAATDFMLPYLHIWESWLAVPQALPVRYEDLLGDYDAEIARLLAHLRLSPTDPAITAVIDQYRPGQSSSQDKGSHFHKGQPERFRDALTPEQLKAAKAVFDGYLQKMGYKR